MAMLDNLDNSLGSKIHARHLSAVVNGANDLVLGSVVKLIRVARHGNPQEFFVRQLDGLTWKEDLHLAATSLIWAWPAFFLNLSLHLLAPILTFASGVALGLSAVLSKDKTKAWIPTLFKALAVMTIGTFAMYVSAWVDVVRAIPVVGHLCRMVFKLIDGQYTKPALPPIAQANLVDETKAPKDADSEALKPLIPARTAVLARQSLLESALNQAVFAGFDLGQSIFSKRQPAHELKNVSKFAALFDRYQEKLADLSLGNDCMQESDLMVVADLMSALYILKQYHAGKSPSRCFHARSTVSSGRVDALEFIGALLKDKNSKLLTSLESHCPSEAELSDALFDSQKSPKAVQNSHYRGRSLLNGNGGSQDGGRRRSPTGLELLRGSSGSREDMQGRVLQM